MATMIPSHFQNAKDKVAQLKEELAKLSTQFDDVMTTVKKEDKVKHEADKLAAKESQEEAQREAKEAEKEVTQATAEVTRLEKERDEKVKETTDRLDALKKVSEEESATEEDKSKAEADIARIQQELKDYETEMLAQIEAAKGQVQTATANHTASKNKVSEAKKNVDKIQNDIGTYYKNFRENHTKELEQKMAAAKERLATAKKELLSMEQKGSDAGLWIHMKKIDRGFSSATKPTHPKMNMYKLHTKMEIDDTLFKMVKFFREDRSGLYKWAMKVDDPTDANKFEYAYLGAENVSGYSDAALKHRFLSETENGNLNNSFTKINEEFVDRKEEMKDFKDVTSLAIGNYIKKVVQYYKEVEQPNEAKDQFDVIDQFNEDISNIYTKFKEFVESTREEQNELKKELEDLTKDKEREINDENGNKKDIYIIQDTRDVLDEVLKTWDIGSNMSYQAFLQKRKQMEYKIAVANDVLKPQYKFVKENKITNHKAEHENYREEMISQGFDASDNVFSDMKILFNWREINDDVNEIKNNGFRNHHYEWKKIVDDIVEKEAEVDHICRKLQKKYDFEAQVYWRHYLPNEQCNAETLEKYLNDLYLKRLLQRRTDEDIIELCKEKAADVVESCDLPETHFYVDNSALTKIQRHLRESQIQKYWFDVSRAAHNEDDGFKLKHKEVKQNSDDGDEADQASKAEPQPRDSQNSQPQASQETPSQTSHGTVGTSQVPEPQNTTSAASPSIGWDATMILAFLIVVFIAN